MYRIKIRDCGEPLVDIKPLCPNIIIDYPKKRLKIEGSAYLRKTVAIMFAKACRNLPESYIFVVRDAWRSVRDQKETDAWIRAKFAAEHPTWSPIRLQREVRRYVAPYKGLHASGHLAGGSLDLGLMKNGKRVPLTSSKLSFQENSTTNQPKLPEYVRHNRHIMAEALEKAGFSNYPHEYWHWSYGEIEWAKTNHKSETMYGTVNLPTRKKRSHTVSLAR